MSSPGINIVTAYVKWHGSQSQNSYKYIQSISFNLSPSNQSNPFCLLILYYIF